MAVQLLAGILYFTGCLGNFGCLLAVCDLLIGEHKLMLGALGIFAFLLDDVIVAIRWLALDYLA